MQFVKRHLAVLMGGAVIVGGTAFAATQQLAAAPTDTVTLAQVGSSEPSDPGGPDGRHPRPGFPRAVRGELVVHAREGDGFETVRFDHGVLERVEGTTLVITEDDGTTVEIPTIDETRIGRDGERATVEDLEPGDHIAAFRMKDGDAFVTKGVRAISPERWEEYQDGREERRDGPHARFRRRSGAAA